MKYDWSKVPSVPAVLRILKKRIEFQDNRISEVFFETLEDFLYYGTLLGYIKNTNFKRILSRLLNIKKVGYIMFAMKDKKSLSLSDRTGIFLSSDLSSSEFEYVMLKEIITTVSSISDKTNRNIATDYLLRKGVYGEERALEDLYLEKGFSLLEDGIVYDILENIYYASNHEKRPIKTSRKEKMVFGNKTEFLSNYKYHPSFQELTIMIGRRILSNSEKLSDDEVLKVLGCEALEDNFSSKLFSRLNGIYGNKAYDIIGKLGIIYKKETDVYNQNIIKDKSLKIIDVKRAYRKLLCYQEERISSKAC